MIVPTRSRMTCRAEKDTIIDAKNSVKNSFGNIKK